MKIFIYTKLITDNPDQLLVIQNQKQEQGKSLLQIKQASSSDKGFYVCVADNGISTIKTKGIMVTVCGKICFGIYVGSFSNTLKEFCYDIFCFNL